MDKYRIRFSKTGRAKYISHLDLLKIFTRMARRTGLDLVYSQGFNPHAELVFSAPLPLGMTSEAEYLDMQLEGPANEDELLGLLSGSLPEGIVPLKIRHLEPGEGNVMRPVAFCRYRMELSFPDAAFREIFPEKLRRCLEGNEPIITAKKSKSGVKNVDIRPLIHSFGEDFCSIAEHGCVFTAVLAAGNEANLRPEVALRGIIDKINGVDAAETVETCENGPDGERISCEIDRVHKLEYLDGACVPLW